MDVGPALGRGADEMRAHVVSERHSRQARHLGRVARGELPRDADVEGGVDALEVVEQEVALRRAAIERILHEAQNHDHRKPGRHGSQQARALRNAPRVSPRPQARDCRSGHESGKEPGQAPWRG
jgi:hypothetical protein